MNTLDWLILATIACAAGWAVFTVIKNHKKNNCSGDCTHCTGCNS